MATRSIVPRLTNEGSIGTTTKWWSDAYLINLHVSTGVFTTNKFAPNVDNSFALGDASHRFSNAYSVYFYGTATLARYADLAEKYTCGSNDVKPGTIMAISNSPEHDVEVCNDDCSDCVVGVVSQEPAFVMNSEAEGIAVGLTGKLPVRVIGPIRRKQAIVSAGDGCARAVEGNSEYSFKIGFSLEENLDSDEKLVMCIVK
jgi:hypothetical protein